MKPTFLCIGVMKSGSTSLISYLNQHPDIYMYHKEIHFFDGKYDEGINFYENHFKTNKKIIGEKTPVYCVNKKYIDRIYKHYPNIKLIIILREPIQRAFSHWNHISNHKKKKIRNLLKNKSFIECIKNDQQKDELDNNEFTNILKRGYYDKQIQYILTKFPRKNVYIGIAEEIRNNKKIEYEKIYKFLGASQNKVKFNRNLDRHKRTYKSKLQIKDLKHLYNIYKININNTYSIIGRKVNNWEKFYKLYCK